ncbi:MAG TPA: hypothetical protein VI685_02360 [Candidatus Angelobacter sp.]
MADIKAKRSVHPAQSRSAKRRRLQRGNLRTTLGTLHRKVIQYPQAKGKIVEAVEFSTSPGYHSISFNFQDKTCLNFSIDTTFTVETDYSDWKSGNQRVIRAWKPVRSIE